MDKIISELFLFLCEMKLLIFLNTHLFTSSKNNIQQEIAITA